MWNALRKLRYVGFHFRRQVPLGRYYADFASHRARLVIELDGETHFVPGAQAYDARRDDFMRQEGYRVLRFTNHDVLTGLDGCLTLVMLALEEPARPVTPTLNPSPQGGGRRKSRRIVELGQRSIDDLPPPLGEPLDPDARTVPDQDQDQK